MKHLLLFFCFFCTNTALYGMEQNSDGVEYEEAETFLNDHCKTQLKSALEKYKNEEFTPQDMDNLLEVLFFITGYDDSVEYIHMSRDDEQNGFFQYALNKIDLPVVQWLIEKGNLNYHLEKECNDFVTFCAEQLSPEIEDTKRKTAYNIVKNVIECYKEHTIFQSCRERFVEDIIILQLQHKALWTQFTIDEQLIIPFLIQDQTKASVELSSLYQTIRDKDGNTLAHIAVQQRDADELYTLMKKNYISKTVENNDKNTVALLAFNKFRSYMVDTTSIDIHKKEAQAARCCHFMLKKYFAEDDFDRNQNCCKEHVIIKKYEVVDTVQNKSQSFIKNVSSTSTNPPLILSEEPQDNRCCGWLLAYFKEKQD